MKKSRAAISLIVIAVLVGLLGFTAFFGFGSGRKGSYHNIKLGLDLAGGASITINAAGVMVNGKKIETDYIYKRQQFAFIDLDEIEESGETATFLRWVEEELDRQIVNSIVAVILRNTTDFTDITTFESLLGTGVTDVFRTAVTVTDATAITFTEARAIADAVRTGIGAKWMVMTQAQLTALAKFKYASGGDDIFRSKEEVAAMLGVDRIYVTDKATAVVCFVPSEYWVKEKNAMAVSYPKYEFNVMNYQRERNIGGAVHGLKSVAFGVEE